MGKEGVIYLITNKQKICLCILNFVSVFLAVMVILPFSVLAKRLGFPVGNINTVELILKFIVLPICVIGVSVYPMIIRRRNYYEQLDVASAPTKMIFIPFAMYASSLLGWIGGVIYASVSYSDTKYLIIISLVWCLSVILFFIFGVFTKWLNKLTGKQMIIILIVTLILFIIELVSCYMIYKNIPAIGEVKESNAFLMIILYLMLFILSMLILWKSIFGNEAVPVVLEKNQEFMEEEIIEIISADIETETQIDFEDYYELHRGEYIEELQAKDSEQNMEGN